jgi:hypothetical protein
MAWVFAPRVSAFESLCLFFFLAASAGRHTIHHCVQRPPIWQKKRRWPVN